MCPCRVHVGDHCARLVWQISTRGVPLSDGLVLGRRRPRYLGRGPAREGACCCRPENSPASTRTGESPTANMKIAAGIGLQASLESAISSVDSSSRRLVICSRWVVRQARLAQAASSRRWSLRMSSPGWPGGREDCCTNSASTRFSRTSTERDRLHLGRSTKHPNSAKRPKPKRANHWTIQRGHSRRTARSRRRR